MCKNNLSCSGKQHCGCPACSKSQSKKIAVKTIPSSSFVPSGYSKKQQTPMPLPKGSGYSKKNVVSINNETPPMIEMIPNKEDNSGLVVASVGFGFLLLIAAIR